MIPLVPFPLNNFNRIIKANTLASERKEELQQGIEKATFQDPNKRAPAFYYPRGASPPGTFGTESADFLFPHVVVSVILTSFLRYNDFCGYKSRDS